MISLPEKLRTDAQRHDRAVSSPGARVRAAAGGVPSILLGALALSLLVAAGSGCVERLLNVRSEPPGADVWVNGDHVGTTPLAHPFTFYGTVGVVVRHNGYESAHVLEELETPWYEHFPLDFFAENVVPWKVRDLHHVEVELAPIVPLEAPEGLARAEERLEAARARAAELERAREARAADRDHDEEDDRSRPDE